jgi:hypothetical protein
VIEQVPEMIGVRMEPLTEQTLAVVEANVTSKPELAVAVSVTDPRSLAVGGTVKAIV